MTAQQDNAALVRDVHQAWNKRDFDRIIALTSPEVEWVMMPTGQKFRGLDGMRQYAQGWATAFPDGRVEDSNLIAGDNGGGGGVIRPRPPNRPPLNPPGGKPAAGPRAAMALFGSHFTKKSQNSGG